MARTAKLQASSHEAELAETIAGFYDDPYGFVMFAFPWNEPGTELEHQSGPDEWQAAQLLRIRDAIRTNPLCQIQEAIASGHGIGKSAEVAWILLWLMSTRRNLFGVVTANTLNQLEKKTWRELAVWHKRLINRHWFEWTATRFYHKEAPELWGIDAVPNSKENSEAFAGQHAEHVVIIYDEASGIPDEIWDVSEGAMTTDRAMWFVYGNPTRNDGRFRRCFGNLSHRWTHRNIDSRTCKMTNKERIEQWRQDHGEDSDFFRVRVRGQFPHTSDKQFIPGDAVAAARRFDIDVVDYAHSPILIGVDPARFGSDSTVISIRQGRKLHAQKQFRGLTTTDCARYAAEEFRHWNLHGTARCKAIFVDGVGIGAGVVDMLRDLAYPAYDVQSAAKAEDDETFQNKRAEMWNRMKVWFSRGQVDIPDIDELENQLVAVQYDFNKRTNRLQIEDKAELKKRISESPDRADSLALTFAEIVIPDEAAATVGAGQSFEPEYC